MALQSTFNVGADCPRFQSYVNDLRPQLRDPDLPAQAVQVFDGSYLLRRYTTEPQHWLHLRMVDGDVAIVAMIRTDNLYLVGFRQERAGGRTWEFDAEDAHGQLGRGRLIQGSEPLGFDGGYNSLGDPQEAPPPGETRRAYLGPGALRNAIRGLAAYERPRPGQAEPSVRSWLVTIIISFIECFRSQEVYAAVLNELKISNQYQARLQVTILYRGPADRSAHHRPRRSTGVEVDDIPLGLTFVQVFAVVILDIDCESLCDLYGTIAVDDGLGPEVLFRRGRSETQSVGPGGMAELHSPKRAIWGYDEISFDLDLSHGSRIPDMSPDGQISKGQMVWNSNERPVEDYNVAQDYVVKGQYGAVKICYAVITNAVVARVVVDLSDVNGGDKGSYTVLYGSITAATSGFPDKIKLFNTDWNHPVATPAGRSIPLLWNVVVVQLGASLKINADIWDRGLLPDMSSPDHKIAKGEAEFAAALAGTVSKAIPGPSGEVKLHVTWSRI